jgi:hypothetical protein
LAFGVAFVAATVARGFRGRFSVGVFALCCRRALLVFGVAFVAAASHFRRAAFAVACEFDPPSTYVVILRGCDFFNAFLMSLSIKRSNASHAIHPKNKRHVILSAETPNTSPKQTAKDPSFFSAPCSMAFDVARS